jgi:hypothetical protein
VQERLRSGSAYLLSQTNNLTTETGEYTQINGVAHILRIPDGAKITKISVYSTGGDKTASKSVNISATAIKIFVTAGLDGDSAILEIRTVAGATLETMTGMKDMSGYFAITLTVSI